MIRTVIIDRIRSARHLLPSDLTLWLAAVLTGLIAMQLARLILVIVTPVSPLGDWRPAAARILPLEMRRTLAATIDPYFRGPAGGEAASFSSDLMLFGIRAGGETEGAAIIGVGDGPQQSYAIGEEVDSGIRLVEVAFDHVILSNAAGARQKLMMPGADSMVAPLPMASAGEDAPAQSASPTAESVKALALAPRRSGTRVTGLMVGTAATPEALASTGLQAGDIIVEVNGAPLSDPRDLAVFQSSLRPGARLMLTVERGASRVPIALNLAN